MAGEWGRAVVGAGDHAALRLRRQGYSGERDPDREHALLLGYGDALCRALVARQQYLPGLEKVDDGYAARWRPVLAGAEADAASALARAMPGACRAIGSEAEAPPETPAIRILADFLAETCDTLVRSAPSQALTVPGFIAPKPRKSKATAVYDSLHDQWLAALRAPDGRMRGEAKELADFAAQVQEWRRPLFLSLAAPFRLCFRLEEPLLTEEDETAAASNASWYVRYLLQSVEDPSLFVPVADAWSQKGVVTPLLRRDDFQPREFLLTALGQASKICPEIEASLKSAAPDGYALQTAGAQDVPDGEGLDAGTGRLRGPVPGVVDPQRHQAAPDCEGHCEIARR